jgi:hypothetical protein
VIRCHESLGDVYCPDILRKLLKFETEGVKGHHGTERDLELLRQSKYKTAMPLVSSSRINLLHLILLLQFSDLSSKFNHRFTFAKMQITTIAVAIVAAASGASAFTRACPFPQVLCGYTLNNGVYGKSLQAVSFLGSREQQLT